jgi:hypothetical protein
MGDMQWMNRWEVRRIETIKLNASIVTPTYIDLEVAYV